MKIGSGRPISGKKAPKSSKPTPTVMPKPRMMHVEGFVKEFERMNRTMKNRRFAFILGAGASRSSGIGTAGDFVNDWLQILYQRDPGRGSLSFSDWLANTSAGISGLDATKPAASYPQVYAATFGNDPDSGYAYLEDAMKNAEPRYGYAVLAYILETTQHKVVITVNFDNLVADALSNFSETFPLVCGHDSLAGFAQPNLRRPLILKVHHDLLYAPQSTPDELRQIGRGYGDAVHRLLAHYTPIAIGYDGNDGSLMGVLNALPRASVSGGIYWCYWLGGDPPRGEIQDLVAQQNGWLVPIPGFDELMAMLGDELKFVMPDEKIKDRAERRANQLVDHAKQLKEKLKVPAVPPPPGAGKQAEVQELMQSQASALKSLEATLGRMDGQRRWWQWEEIAIAEKNPDKKEQIYKQAVAELPDSAPLLGNYAVFLETIKGDYDRAQEFYERALKADPNDPDNLGNYASFLETIKNDFSRAREFYERALKADFNRANNLGNYASFLETVENDYGRAREFYERALKADPNDAYHLGNYASFLETVKNDYSRAQEFYERALKADPNDADHLGNYANFIKNIKNDYNRAQEFYERALKADPNHANNLGNYAGFLLAQRRDTEGLLLLDRAIAALSPDAPKGLDVEVWFYAFVHRPAQQRAEALTNLKKLIVDKGSRSPGWDLSQNVQCAVLAGHPDAPWLPKLAEVISGKADPLALSNWPAWQNTKQTQ